MPNAAEIIKDMLKEVGIDHQYDEEEMQVTFKMNEKCQIDVSKHRYVAGYGTRAKCDINTNKLDFSASFIERFMVMKDKDHFYLYGISSDAALNAGKLEVKIPVKKEPKDSGTFYIKCKDFGYECELEKSKL